MKKLWVVAVLLITASIFALDDFSVPHTWSPGDTIRDSDFEANNDTIEAWAARTNDSLDAKFLRTSAMGDSQWVKIKVDTLIADSIKARVLAITTYSPDSLYGRTARLSGDIFADSIYARVLKMSAGIIADSCDIIYGKFDTLGTNGAGPSIKIAETMDFQRSADIRMGEFGDIIVTDGNIIDSGMIWIKGSTTSYGMLRCAIIWNDSTYTRIIKVDSIKVGANRVISSRGTALTSQLTSLTHTAPGAPDYAVQNLTNSGSFGFVTADEGNTVLSVILNLQTRVAELEARLKATGGHGLIADP